MHYMTRVIRGEAGGALADRGGAARGDLRLQVCVAVLATLVDAFVAEVALRARLAGGARAVVIERRPAGG
jgi:hypothetical protein